MPGGALSPATSEMATGHGEQGMIDYLQGRLVDFSPGK